MIVARWVWKTKPHAYNEFAEAIKTLTEYDIPRPPHGWRIYRPHTLGPWYKVIWEVEFESLTEYDAWVEELWTAPGLPEWHDLRHDLVAGEGGGEVWIVESFS